MSRRTLVLAVAILLGCCAGKSAQAQFFGPPPIYGGFGGGFGGFGGGFGGFGGGYGGFGGYGNFGPLPFSPTPFPFTPVPPFGYFGGIGTHPLYGMGLTPIGVQSALGELSLRNRSMLPPVSTQPPLPFSPGSTMTITAPGGRSYSYRIVNQ